MELNLNPQAADATVFEGEGGAYYAWTRPAALVQGKVGAGKLVLQPRGFALPHYADSSKIGYVTQGTCTVGLIIILPNNSKEEVLVVNKGEAIMVPMGTPSWWFNGGDSVLTIVFLGETSQSYTPGQFDYYFLTGSIGFLNGFSSEFISKIYKINESDSQKLAKSQTNPLVVKLDGNIDMPNQSNCSKLGKYVIDFNDGMITSENFSLIGKIGISASYVKIEPDSVFGPSYSTDGSYQIIYVIKGSGKIQIVGLSGQQYLDAKVEEGELFVVPKFFALALIADGEGLMELFSVITSSRPVLGHLAGKQLSAVSSSVLEASLNVDTQFVNFFKSLD
ncbi:hypothetical protein ACJIZ3_015751 [Penstemon smallii]|uniref:Cupin type-1 domain-containing protein n=1 Tax=Penstemon smallii TaxID=265156 RepID=A0ABD3RNM4_9LAMI